MNHPTHTETVKENRRTWLAARIISDAANPYFLPPILFTILCWQLGVDTLNFVYILALSLLFFTVIPVGYLTMLRRRGVIDTLDMTRQHSRSMPFLFTLLCYSAYLVPLNLIQADITYTLSVITVIYTINILMVYLVNLKWKISIHNAGVASFIAAIYVLLLESGTSGTGQQLWLYFIFIVFILSMMWSRTYLKVHSPGQVVSGALFGFLFTYILLHLLL